MKAFIIYNFWILLGMSFFLTSTTARANTFDFRQEKMITIKDTVRIDELRLKGLGLCQKASDSAIVFINRAIHMSKILNDNLRIAKGLNCLGIAYNSNSNFEKSFLLYKEALGILENEGPSDTKSGIYNNIGNIYQTFSQYDLAEKYYLQSIDVLMQINSPVKASFLNNTLGNLALISFYEKKYEKSLSYIEKAQKVLDNESIDQEIQDFRNARILLLKGFVYLKLGDITIAERLILENYKIIESLGGAMDIAKANYYMGNLYMAKGKYEEAITHFLKALTLSNSIRNLSLKAEIQSNLAVIHQRMKKHKLAFEYLTISTALKDSLFGTHNTWKILELKESYEKQQQEQALILIQKEKKIDDLIRAVYLFVAIAIGLFGLLYFRYVRIKYKKEKKLIEKEKQIAELELTKTKDILEIKNKELTTSALQIIQDGELIKQFKDDINEIKRGVDDVHQQKIEHLLASVNRNSKKNWDAFKVRFEQINSGFFEKLREEYPTLTPSELKLCSFLKLHFNSKDIASLMGISSKSVKMGRYRLRKKFDLDRNVNLTEFISRF